MKYQYVRLLRGLGDDLTALGTVGLLLDPTISLVILVLVQFELSGGDRRDKEGGHESGKLHFVVLKGLRENY